MRSVNSAIINQTVKHRRKPWQSITHSINQNVNQSTVLSSNQAVCSRCHLHYSTVVRPSTYLVDSRSSNQSRLPYSTHPPSRSFTSFSTSKLSHTTHLSLTKQTNINNKQPFNQSVSQPIRSFAKKKDHWGYPSLLSLGSWETAKGIQLRHADCSEQLENPELSDNRVIAQLSKEVRQLDKTAELVIKIEKLRKEITQCNELIHETHQTIRQLSNASLPSGESIQENQSMLEMARDDLQSLLVTINELESQLIDHLLPSAEDATKNAIIEVRAGTGGEEAALFAREMFGMYESFAALRGWGWEVITIYEGEFGGYKEATALITGDSVYGEMQYETGVHRVQRVPATESQGRVHTSAMTVAVLPEAEEIDVDINESKDLRIDVFRSGGKGGQHVNTTDSAVRITHIPTGMVVAIQDERSLIQNKAKAIRLLRSRLYEQAKRREREKRDALRSSQIGHGERNERIRTYNFSQNRVTDHRVNLTKHSLDRMMAGEFLDDFAEALRHQQRLEAIQQMSE